MLSSSETSDTISLISEHSDQSLRPPTAFQFLLFCFSSLALLETDYRWISDKSVPLCHPPLYLSVSQVRSYFHHISDTPPFVPVPLVSPSSLCSLFHWYPFLCHYDPLKTSINNSWTSTTSYYEASLCKLNIVISRLYSGQTTCQISSSTGFSIGTISKIDSEHFFDLPKSSGDYPVRLSPANVHHAVNFITSGKAEAAVQVLKAIQHVTNQPFTPQTMCRHLRQSGMKAVVKKQKPILS